jgi:hypothetical protein
MAVQILFWLMLLSMLSPIAIVYLYELNFIGKFPRHATAKA